jgi:tetratricopeptide (TPR) repeat protein
MPAQPSRLTVEVRGESPETLDISGQESASVWAAVQGATAPAVAIAPPVFVSYASADRERYIIPLVRQLQSAGLSVWFDKHTIEGGDEWKREIDEGLRKCSAVIAALTPRAVEPDREWVRYEHLESQRLFAPVIPVMLEPCKYPAYFKHLQYITMHPDIYEEGYARLLDAITRSLHRRGRWLVDQTPSATRPFIGRERELKEVYKKLHDGDTLAVTAQTTVAVHGMGGLGKTMLVEELVRRLGPRYPGGVLFEHRGQNPPDAQDVLHRWVAYAAGSAPGGLVRPADVRAMFAGVGELLVVIDDIWPSDFRAVKQLLEALPVDAERILTTRFADGAKALGARLYSLRTLTQSDGMEMLFDRLAGNGPPPSKNLLRRLHRMVGGHALSLELAAGRCKDTSRLPIQVKRLEERIRAGDLSKVAMGVPGLGRDVSLQVSLEESISALQDADAQNGTRLAERLMMLGVFAEEAPFDCEAAAAVWGDGDLEDAEEALDTLEGYALVSAERGRFTQHIILRAYALGLMQQNPALQELAEQRHMAHFLRIAAEFEPERWREIEAQNANIAHAAERVCNALGDHLINITSWPASPKHVAEFDEVAAQAALAMAEATVYYVRQRRVHAGRRWMQAGVAAARLLGDRGMEGRLLGELGHWHAQRSERTKALSYYRHALTIRQETGDQTAVAQTLNGIGVVFRVLDQPAEALAHYEQALAIWEELDDPHGIAVTLNNLGVIYRDMRQPDKALDYYERSLPYREESGDRIGLAVTLNNIGRAYRDLGEFEKALIYYEQALPIREEVDDQVGMGVSFNDIGLVYRDLARPDEALEFCTRALAIRKQLGDPARLATTLDNLGLIYGDLSQPEQSLSHHEQSLALWEGLNDLGGLATTLVNVARLLHDNPAWGRRGEACACLERAIALIEESGHSFDRAGRSVDDLQRMLDRWLAESTA